MALQQDRLYCVPSSAYLLADLKRDILEDPGGGGGDITPPSGGELLSLSPRGHSGGALSPSRHTTPFSVSDILSPLEEQRRALDLLEDRRVEISTAFDTSYGRGAPLPTMQHVSYATGPTGPPAYCAPEVYDTRGPSSWYQSSASDPRFASKLNEYD